MKKNKFFTPVNMTVTAMLAAVSVVAYYFLEIPVSAHLKVNFADVPAVVGGLVISPFAAVVIILIRCVLHLFKTSTLGIGETADFLIGTAMVIPFLAAFKFALKIAKKGVAYAVAVCVGFACAIIGGFAVNAVLYPIYMAFLGIPIESTEAFLTYIFGTSATNALRSGMTFGVCAFLLPFTERFRRLIKRG